MEIKGLPCTPNENKTDMLNKLGREVEEKIMAANIEVCDCVPVANITVNKSISAQFVHRKRRHTVLEKLRKMRLSTKVLGFGNHLALYVNEHL